MKDYFLPINHLKFTELTDAVLGHFLSLVTHQLVPFEPFILIFSWDLSRLFFYIFITHSLKSCERKLWEALQLLLSSWSDCFSTYKSTQAGVEFCPQNVQTTEATVFFFYWLWNMYLWIKELYFSTTFLPL